jgi:type I restriction enzyme S subunit
MFNFQPLGDFVSHQFGGGTPSRQVLAYWGGSIPWASVKDFSDGEDSLLSTQESITDAALRASASNLIPAMTPLVCTRMAVGRAAMAPMPIAINQDVKALVPNAGTDPGYFLRLLQYIRPKAEALAVGSTVKGIRVNEYLSIPVPGAPQEEQPHIANILETLDTTIRQTEAIIEKLKQVKQGLLHDLLTRGIDANGELRPPQSEAPELYKESALGWIPKGWNVSSLKEILAPVDPAMRSGPFGSALLKDELVSSGYPLLGIDNVQVEHFLAEFSRFVTEKKFNELARYAVRPHDLMITIMGTVGRCCTVPKDIGNALSSKHTWTLTLDQTKYLPTLAMLQINYAPWVLKQFAEDEQGGIMSAIRSDTLRKLILPTPPIEEQHEIELRLNSITQRIEVESVSLAKAKLEKSGLMDDLLTGRMRVTPLLESAAA